MRTRLLSGLLLLVLAGAVGCTTDALPEPTEAPCDNLSPTYETDIRPIVEATCAYSGCHLGTAPGIYTSYEGVLPQLESGSFRERVITMRADQNLGMPPDYAPSDRPRDLDEEDLLLIECWLEAGFPRE